MGLRWWGVQLQREAQQLGKTRSLTASPSPLQQVLQRAAQRRQWAQGLGLCQWGRCCPPGRLCQRWLQLQLPHRAQFSSAPRCPAARCCGDATGAQLLGGRGACAAAFVEGVAAEAQQAHPQAPLLLLLLLLLLLQVFLLLQQPPPLLHCPALVQDAAPREPQPARPWRCHSHLQAPLQAVHPSPQPLAGKRHCSSTAWAERAGEQVCRLACCPLLPQPQRLTPHSLHRCHLLPPSAPARKTLLEGGSWTQEGQQSAPYTRRALLQRSPPRGRGSRWRFPPHCLLRPPPHHWQCAP